MSKDDDYYEPKEADQRRDEVVRRMANTPPQPKSNPSRRQKTKTKAGTDRVTGRGRARRED